MKKSGSCLCKAVTVTMDVTEESFAVCHCGMCRKWGGGPFFTPENVKNIQFKGEENITRYNSSDWAQRCFCKKCGTHLFYFLKGKEMIIPSLGLLDDISNFKFHQQIFVDSNPGHYSFANKTEMLTQAQVFAKHAPPQN